MDDKPPIVDVVGLGIFLAGLVYAPNVAAIVGPYVVIILASILGASFAVKRRQKTTRLAALAYFLRVAGVAVIGTVIIAGVVAAQYETVTERMLIAPIAFVIGALDWSRVGAYLTDRLLALADTFRGRGPQ